MVFVNKIYLDAIEIPFNVCPVKGSLSESGIFNSKERAGGVIKFVSKKKIVLNQCIVAKSISGHYSKSDLLVIHDCPVVPGEVAAAVTSKVRLESVVGMAFFGLV